MVEIAYRLSQFDLTVKGHAGAAPKGEDIVCAAVTILTRTFAQNARIMDRSGIVSGLRIELEPGNAHISCKPAKKYKSVARTVLEGICLGFEMLEQEYPEYVKFKAVE